MPKALDEKLIRGILRSIGERVKEPADLILIGGAALTLLGSRRPTVDIDFMGNDLKPGEFDKLVMQVALKQNIYADPVPLDSFIPMPEGHESRRIKLGNFGKLTVYAADPYSIALGKLERGLDTDLEDIIFLLRKKLIELAQLQRVVDEALPHAAEFEMNAEKVLAHLDAMLKRVK